MAVVKNKSTPEMRKFWEHVEAVAEMVRAREAAAPAPQVTAPEPKVTAAELPIKADTLLCIFLSLARQPIWDGFEALAKHASSLLAERDRTITELRRQAEGLCDGCGQPLDDAFCAPCIGKERVRAEQTEQVFCEAHSVADCKSCPCCAAVEERIKRDQAEQERNALKGRLTALEIMVSATGWGAAYGACREDYPDYAAMVDRFAQRIAKESEATAERPRGLLREVDGYAASHKVECALRQPSASEKMPDCDCGLDALRQRIQKELEGGGRK